jgi:hypothetical protein
MLRDFPAESGNARKLVPAPRIGAGTWRALTTLRGSMHHPIWPPPPTASLLHPPPPTARPRPPFARLRRCKSLCREPDSESPIDISTTATACCQSGCRPLPINGRQCGRRRRHASLNFVAPQSPRLLHFHLHDTLYLSRQTRSPLNSMVRATTLKGFSPPEINGGGGNRAWDICSSPPPLGCE